VGHTAAEGRHVTVNAAVILWLALYILRQRTRRGSTRRVMKGSWQVFDVTDVQAVDAKKRRALMHLDIW